MNDYIKRSDAIKTVCGDCEYYSTNDCEDCRLDRLTKIPAADVRQVVYCLECIYNNKCFTQSFVESESIKSFDRNTFFCADGERREGGTP